MTIIEKSYGMIRGFVDDLVRSGLPPDDDSLELYQIKRLNLAIISLVLFVPLFSSFYLYLGIPKIAIGTLITGVLAVCCLFWFRKTKNIIFIANFVLLTYAILVFFSAIYLGGINSSSLWWNIHLPILAILLLSVRWAILWTTVVISEMFFFTFLTLLNILPANPLYGAVLVYHDSATKIIALALLFVFGVLFILERAKTIGILKQTNAQLDQHVEELAHLYRASKALVSSETTDLNTLSQAIVEVMLCEFGQSNCSLLLVDPDSPDLIRAAVAGPYADEVSLKKLTLNGPGLAPLAIASGEIINVPDVRVNPDYVADWRSARSELAIPLKVGEKVIGVIDMQCDQPDAFSERDLRLMSTFVGRAALALENTRLYVETQQHLRELEMLYDLSHKLRRAESIEAMLPVLLNELQPILEANSGAVTLLQPDGEHFRITRADGFLSPLNGQVFSIQKGVCGYVFRTRKPYAAQDYATDPHRLDDLSVGGYIGPSAFVPLESESALLGVLALSRFGNPQAQPFTPAEMRLLAAIGEMAGNALRRIGLFDDARRRLKRVQALRKVDMAITGSLYPQITLRVLLDEITALREVDAATVLLLNPHTQSLEFKVGRGFHTKAIEHTHLRLGEGYAGRAALRRGIVHISDVTKIEGFTRAHLLIEEGFVAYYGAPMITKGRVLGVLETFHRKPIQLDSEWTDFLEALASQAAIVIENSQLFHDLEQSNTELRLAYDATIAGWSRAMDLRDEETEGHTQRVTELTIQLARQMGVSDEQLVHMRRGALLHDMGKLGVPDAILHKPGPLTDEEWKIMRRHPKFAYDMLSPVEYLHPALEIPYCHHEKWDGTGYPRGLKGEQIPLAARIFSVVDVWDALNSDRPYRKAWKREKAIAYIQEQSGIHFDPQVVKAFLALVDSE